MKKLFLSLLFFVEVSFANGLLQNISIDRELIDFSKDEMVNVSFRQYYRDFSSYQLYSRETNEVFLDIKTVAKSDFLRNMNYYQQTIPITFKPLLGTHLNAGHDEAKITLNIREINYLNQVVQSNKFEIKVLDSREPEVQAVTDPTGAWYQPSLNGVGFYVMQLSSGTSIQYYGYDNSGQLIWLISEIVKDAWSKGQPKTFNMYKGHPDSSTNFNQPPMEAPGIKTWGKLTLQFNDCSSGKATLNGNDGEQAFNLIKLAAPSNINCMVHQ